MLKITICDDLRELCRIFNLLSQYQSIKEPAFKYTSFSNTIDLLETMKKNAYHVLLLDVLMPRLNGIEAASEIRSFGGEINGYLSDFEKELLSREVFIKVHLSFIVNMAYIHSLSPRELTTCTKQVVPISRLLYGQVRDAYMQYLFLEMGVK